MRKLFWVLGLGLILTGCGDNTDQPVKTDSTTGKNTKNVHETENIVNETNDATDKTSALEDKSALKSNRVSADKAQTNLEKHSLKPQSQEKTSKKSAQRNSVQDKGIGADGLSAEERRVNAYSTQPPIFRRIYKVDCNYQNLSAEERRVTTCY